MQKFALVFLVATTALLGFVSPVESQSIEYRETNAERFARGMPPLPPNKRTETNVAKRSKPSKRAPTPAFELEERSHPSKRATPVLEQRSKPSKRSTPALEERSRPSKRSTPVLEERSRPSKRAPSPAIVERSKPSKRAPTPANEKRSKPSKRAATPVFEKRSKPSKRAATPAEKRSKPSKRATTPAEKRSKPSKRAESYQMQQSYAGRLEVRWASNGTTAGFVANNPTGGSFGLTDPSLFGDDLYVEYYGSNLMALNPEFPPPYFVGGSVAHSLVHDCSNKLEFANVELGPSSAIWTLNSLSGALNATLINQDGSEYKPTLAYNPEQNVLSFTSPPAEYPVYIYLSD